MLGFLVCRLDDFMRRLTLLAWPIAIAAPVFVSLVTPS
jgi:hypothetical protein